MAASQRTVKSSSSRERNVLPLANFADGAEHRLEIGELLLRSSRPAAPCRRRAMARCKRSRQPRRSRSAATARLAQAARSARPVASSCQTSSVRNGIIGCSSRSSTSSAWASTRWAVCALLGHREPGLRHLDVEAAELVPGEVVERAGRVGVAVVVRGRRSLAASRSRAARGASGLRAAGPCRRPGPACSLRG